MAVPALAPRSGKHCLEQQLQQAAIRQQRQAMRNHRSLQIKLAKLLTAPCPDTMQNVSRVFEILVVPAGGNISAEQAAAMC